MYQRPTSPQLIGGVLDDAFRLLKASFTQVVGLAVVASAVSGVWRLFDDTLENLIAGEFDPEAVSLGSVAPMLMVGLVGLYFNLSAAARMSAVAINRPISVAEALRRALLRFPALLVCVLAFVLLCIAPFMLAALLIAAIGVAGILGLLALAPALVLLVYLYLSSFLVVTANIGGVAALRRSFNLVRHNFWRATVVLTIGSIVLFAATMMIGMVGLAVAALAGFGSVSVDVAAYVVETAGRRCYRTVLDCPIAGAVEDLELRREGEDLATRIKAVR